MLTSILEGAHVVDEESGDYLKVSSGSRVAFGGSEAPSRLMRFID